jgi:hypothetical protein
MASNSVLLKQRSNKVTWFDYVLESKKHYYPIASDLSDIVSAIDDLEGKPDIAMKMVK